MNPDFAELIKKYRRSPEFLFVELTDPNQRGMTGDTLLHAASIRGDLHDVAILIACGATVNAVGDLGNTPLHHAASRGLDAIVRFLLQNGADRAVRNEFGQSPIDLARLNQHKSVIDVLEHGRSSRKGPAR